MKGCKKGGCWAGRRRRTVKGGNFYGFSGAISPGAAVYGPVTNNGASTTGAIPDSDISKVGGRRHGMTAKAMKRALKKAGLKVSGKKATLTKRMKKAKLAMKGGSYAGMIPSPHASAGYSGQGVAGLINVSDVAGSVSNNVTPSS